MRTKTDKKYMGLKWLNFTGNKVKEIIRKLQITLDDDFQL